MSIDEDQNPRHKITFFPSKDRGLECDFTLPKQFVWSIAASGVAYFARDVGDLSFIAPGRRFWANNQPFVILRHIASREEVRRRFEDVVWPNNGRKEAAMARLEQIMNGDALAGMGFEKQVWVEVSTD